MKAIRRFTVRPALPERLSALTTLAGNLRWSWHGPTRDLFSRLAPELWESGKHDPAAIFAHVTQASLDELAADDDFVEQLNDLNADLERYLGEPRWYQGLDGEKPQSIAYFSPEFGIAAALPQYSGGLGILAGDHLKSASDLGVPIVGVGLFYRAGYFSQSLSHDGWQQETYPVVDPDGLPLRVLRLPDGSAAVVTLALPDGQTMSARVWEARVGRVSLLLLDSDIPENSGELLHITDRLYGGGEEHRLRQELLLGIGGVRALALWSELTGRAMPTVFHTNEGHAGFLGLERIADLIGVGLSFDEALQAVRGSTVFTTHTPVAAGIDRFSVDLIRTYLESDLLPGVDADDALALGREVGPEASPGVFNMAYMGLRLAQRANGVSRLHGEVSRRMFNPLWPGFDATDVPIGSITNGVHPATWTHPVLSRLARESLGTTETSAADWSSENLSDAELWNARDQMRALLVEDARRRVSADIAGRNPGSIVPSWVHTLLDPGILTIGFARRVPTYKRLTLMLHDQERLRRILLHPEHPVQIVVAGKSHPADDEGKRLIQQLVQFAAAEDIRQRIVFLPDYDIAMAKSLYPGTDVWLNNPLRPLEACGTSGMKAALNGSLNLSILDGWWNEYFDGENGWAIPSADDSVGPQERDRLEAEALYDLIEHEIAPRFYDRDDSGIPVRWMRSVRHTLSTLSPRLSADRMVEQYVREFYLEAHRSGAQLRADGYAAAKSLSAWKERVRTAWPSVAIAHVESGGLDSVPQVGEELHLRVYVELDGLTTDDVAVEVVYGRVEQGETLAETRVHELEPIVDDGRVSMTTPRSGAVEYAGTLALTRAGSFGYTVRVVPQHDLLVGTAELGLVTSAE
ncbi:alpha-glucan family phosphorylase [Okibacterium endophyticum]